MNDSANIVVVDDENDLRELVTYNLRHEGFKVSGASDGREALKLIREKKPDLVVLDLMLPGIQGTDLCRMLRADPETSGISIIMLTAKSEESDKIVGLELGADDYVTKPFSPKELVARIRAVLRRSVSSSSEKERPPITIGDMVIDPETHVVTKDAKDLNLSAKEFRLLLYMAERRGRVLSRDVLLDAVWGNESYVEPRTVDVHIRRLRMQIESDPAHPEYIRTRRGAGYYIEGDG